MIYLTMILQLALEKENYEFQPAKLRKKLLLWEGFVNTYVYLTTTHWPSG